MVGEAAVTALGVASQALHPPEWTMVLPPRVPHGTDHSHHQQPWLSAYTELQTTPGAYAAFTATCKQWTVVPLNSGENVSHL